MTLTYPTYPENIRLLGPSSWEEIESHRTDTQITGIQPPSSHMHISSPLILLISDTQASFASLAWLGLSTSAKFSDFCLKWHPIHGCRISNWFLKWWLIMLCHGIFNSLLLWSLSFFRNYLTFRLLQSHSEWMNIVNMSLESWCTLVPLHVLSTDGSLNFFAILLARIKISPNHWFEHSSVRACPLNLDAMFLSQMIIDFWKSSLIYSLTLLLACFAS